MMRSSRTLLRTLQCVKPARSLTLGSSSTLMGSSSSGGAPFRASSQQLSTAAASTASEMLSEAVATTPHMDVVHYHHKNRTWTLQHVQYYSEALAIGFLENGFQPGDVVLSWLPQHFSEEMVLQFACSKAGLILYNLDPELATTDLAKAQDALAAALTITNANILVSQEAGSDVNYVEAAHGVIPELRIYDTACGAPFVTPRFPHLRMAVQTGFDQDDKMGWFPMRHMIVPSNNLDSYVSAESPDAPLAGELVLDGDGIPTSTKVHTHAQVMKQNMWPTYKAILEKKYHEVEGVGVIF